MRSFEQSSGPVVTTSTNGLPEEAKDARAWGTLDDVLKQTLEDPATKKYGITVRFLSSVNNGALEWLPVSCRNIYIPPPSGFKQGVIVPLVQEEMAPIEVKNTQPDTPKLAEDKDYSIIWRYSGGEEKGPKKWVMTYSDTFAVPPPPGCEEGVVVPIIREEAVAVGGGTQRAEPAESEEGPHAYGVTVFRGAAGGAGGREWVTCFKGSIFVRALEGFMEGLTVPLIFEEPLFPPTPDPTDPTLPEPSHRPPTAPLPPEVEAALHPLKAL